MSALMAELERLVDQRNAAEAERDALRARVALLEAELSEALKLGAAVSRAEAAEARVKEIAGKLTHANQEANDARRGRNAARAQVGAMRAALEEYHRKLLEVWGKEEDPHAVACGWSKLARDATLSASVPAQEPAEVES